MDEKMRGRVRVEDYDPAWRDTFRAVEEVLLGQAGDLVRAVEHVGSTSVEGLAAKPIVDIDIVTENMPALAARLAQIGFIHEGDLGIPGREAFRRKPSDALPPYHLYACPPDGAELMRHLAFRACLRDDAALRAEYSRVKKEAAQACPGDIDGYMARKDACCQSILDIAASRGYLLPRYAETGAVTVRPMTVPDYEAAFALWHATKGMGMRALDDSRESVTRFLQRNPGLSFVAEARDEGICGTILCGQDGRRGYIYHTAVRESLRGRGIGRRMALAALAGLRAQGIRKAALVAFSANESGNAFWEKMGFTRRDDLTYRNFTIAAQ